MKRVQKKALSIVMVLAMVLSMFSGMTVSASADTTPAVWDGTTVDTSWYSSKQTEFTISTAAQLAGLAQKVNGGEYFDGKTIKLGADIYLNSDADPTANVWTPIAQYMTADGATQHPFMGTLDGQGHYIYNLYINDGTGNSSTNEANALIGYNAGTVTNLGVTGEINTYRRGAGIAGINTTDGTITKCYSYVSINANGGGGTRGTGGIAGTNEGSVSYCINRGSIYNAYRRAGGIAGFNTSTGNVDHCYNVGSAASASSGYSGSIVASNAGSVTECYYLANSASAAVNDITYEGNTGTSSDIREFNTSANVTSLSKDLLTALNNSGTEFIAAASGAYPVLSWQTDFVWDLCTVIVKQPANGGTITESTIVKDDGSEEAFTGSVKVKPGTSIKISASVAEDGYIFAGLSDGGSKLRGNQKTGPYSYTFTVNSDTTLTAVYTAKTDTAITIYEQYGNNGYKTAKKTYTWNELLGSTLDTDTHGYLYGSAGNWSAVASTKLITLDTMLTGAGITVADSDLIVAADATGADPSSKGSLPTYSQIKNSTNYYPNLKQNAEGETSHVIGTEEWNSPETVPAGIAIEWNSGSAAAGKTIGENLSTIAGKAYNSGSLRFVYGSSASDTCLNDKTTSGARLWSGVTSITVRRTSTSYSDMDSITAAPLTSDSGQPYTTYSAANDSGKIKISATGLSAYGNLSDKTVTSDKWGAKADNGGVDKGYWVGIEIPIPSGTSNADIRAGSNASAMVTPAEDPTDNNRNHTFISANKLYYYWDSLSGGVDDIYVSFNAGNTIYEIPVDTSGVEKNVLNLTADSNAYTLQMSDLESYGNTYNISLSNDTEKHSINAISISDFIKLVKNKNKLSISPAEIKFSDNAGYTAYIFNDGTDTLNRRVLTNAGIDVSSDTKSDFSGHSWDDVYIAWNVDGAAIGGSGLRLYVNNAPNQKQWVSNLSNVEIIAENAVSFDGRYVSDAQLKAAGTVSNALFSRSGKTTEYYISGVSVQDMSDAGLISDFTDKASVQFYADDSDHGSATIYQTDDYDWAKVVLAYSYKEGSSGSELLTGTYRAVVNNSAGNLWTSGVKSINTADAAFNIEVSGKTYGLSDAQFKKYETVKNMSMGTTPYTVTGITLDDLFSNYFGNKIIAGITLPEDLKATFPLLNKDKDFSDAMIIWSMVDASNIQQSTGGYRFALDGGAGSYWWSGITKMTTTAGDYYFDGRGIQASQFTGTTLNDLISYAGPASASEKIAKIVANTTEFTDYTKAVTDATAVSTDLRGWYNVTFDVKDASGTAVSDTTITVADDENAFSAVSSTNGTYLLEGGHRYSYSVSKDGYTPSGGILNIGPGTVLPVAVTLNAKSSGGSSSAGGAANPDVAVKTDAILNIYTMTGAEYGKYTAGTITKGSRTRVASLTESELIGLMNKNSSGYIYQYGSDTSGWSGVVATGVIKLTDLFSEAGVTVTNNDSINQYASDGFSTTLPYTTIKASSYFYNPANNGKSSEVPAGLALWWESGDIGTAANQSALASTATKNKFATGNIRFVVGITPSQYANNATESIGGYRLGAKITELTIITDWTEEDTTKRITGGGTNSGAVTTTTPTETDKTIESQKTTTDAKTGTITETTKYTDGSSKVVETETNGTVTTTDTATNGDIVKEVDNADKSKKITMTNVDGSGSVTNVDAAGQTDVAVTVSASQVKAAEGDAAITLAMPAVSAPAAASDTKTTVKVNLPSGTAEAKVSIPVSNVTEGTVAVIVNEDGTETIIQTTVPADGAITATVPDGATLKIVDNTKNFNDVSDSAWSADAIQFVTSREIFNGTGNGNFSTAEPMTRSMLMTVLARLDGQDTTGGSTWYEKGMNWAKAAGISDGSNPEGDITREQLATMLYRYSGEDESDTGNLTFTDKGDISDYAKNAIAWAVKNGILTGMNDGSLQPQAKATREQVAAITQRFIKAS